MVSSAQKKELGWLDTHSLELKWGNTETTRWPGVQSEADEKYDRKRPI